MSETTQNHSKDAFALSCKQLVVGRMMIVNDSVHVDYAVVTAKETLLEGKLMIPGELLPQYAGLVADVTQQLHKHLGSTLGDTSSTPPPPVYI